MSNLNRAQLVSALKNFRAIGYSTCKLNAKTPELEACYLELMQKEANKVKELAKDDIAAIQQQQKATEATETFELDNFEDSKSEILATEQTVTDIPSSIETVTLDEVVSNFSDTQVTVSKVKLNRRSSQFYFGKGKKHERGFGKVLINR